MLLLTRFASSAAIKESVRILNHFETSNKAPEQKKTEIIIILDESYKTFSGGR